MARPPPRRRNASTARNPASEAPTTTMGSVPVSGTAPSPFELDGAGGALPDGALGLAPQRLRRLLLKNVEEAIVPDLEDFRGRFRAEAVALTHIEIDNNFHGFCLQFTGIDRPPARINRSDRGLTYGFVCGLTYVFVSETDGAR